MPLPLLFIGAAVASGAIGAGTTAKAVADNSKAASINRNSSADIETAKDNLEYHRSAVSTALEQLGEEKLNVLNTNISDFLSAFEKIKNVDFQSSLGLEELKNLNIDENSFKELKELGNFAVEVAGGAAAGVIGGALTALGAYGAATTFASASTGTAIATLSGAAAHNATLAFFGGGALTSGGLGMAGGTAVLGGLVAGPALMVMGLITSVKSHEKLEDALANKAQAAEIITSLDAASLQCISIRRRTYMLYNLLARLDSVFLPKIWKMEDIIENEGTDYRDYKQESKELIAETVSTACSIKAVLDTPILTPEGELTEASEQISEKINSVIYK